MKEQYWVVRRCLVDNIKNICNDMHKKGYEVISVVYDVECNRYVIVGKLINEVQDLKKHYYLEDE